MPMKAELSSLDLHFLVQELKSLINGKIDQIYQSGKDELVLQTHSASLGKKILRILPGGLVYLASTKPETPIRPPGFCTYLRKYLKNARIREVKQIDFERVLEFVVETKEQKYRIIIELFNKGNIIICSEEYIIFSALNQKVWTDRVSETKTYVYPSREINILECDLDEFSKVLLNSDKENIVKSLAMDLGFGGIYAEEICEIAKIDKTLTPKNSSREILEALFDAISILLAKPSEPVLINGSDLYPIKLESINAKEVISFSSFNALLDSVFTIKQLEAKHENIDKTATKQLSKIEVMIDEQKKRIIGLEKSSAENQKKGEAVFENYSQISTLLENLNILFKEKSFKEFNKLIKDFDYISSFDQKTKEVVILLKDK